MTYEYTYDRTSMGNRWWFKDTYSFYQKGLKRLRALLDSMKETFGTETHPYAQEVQDLTNMIEYADERLAKLKSDNDEFFVRGISVGSMRYLKAGAMLQILEKERQLAERENEGIPAGVATAIRQDIHKMRSKAELLPVEPADCLWEVIPRPAPTKTVPEKEAAQVGTTPGAATTPIRQPSRRKKWDVFVSYAAEDANIAQPVAETLQREGFTVWYDRFILTVGDSLLAKIDEGLARSRYGVVILSHNFFKEAWPKKELDGQLGRLRAGTRK